MAISVDENKLKLVLERLDAIKLELLRLRALFLLEEEATEDEKKAIVDAKKEIANGKTTSLEGFLLD